jgi:hypothetical protein
LARLSVIQYYETAFRKVTGMSLKVIPPFESNQRLSFGEFENPFCSLVTKSPAGCNACWTAEKRAERGAAGRLIPEQVSGFPGLTDVAVPVIVNGQHVTTLISGQIFRRPPTERDFQMIFKMLKSEANADWERKTRKAYFETPVVTPDSLRPWCICSLSSPNIWPTLPLAMRFLPWPMSPSQCSALSNLFFPMSRSR